MFTSLLHVLIITPQSIENQSEKTGLGVRTYDVYLSCLASQRNEIHRHEPIRI